ncbi:hypothetical protein KFK09_011590 [Dendrobium nobile]|uniref:Uncharacterized protein n=1 Tax=Dendrobium nobile TaxID=94219 RepID=A0A8T3BF07_DENNO|nr:hypothetical protein KFK09_011590 [Dendrobium nobile]
MLPLSKEDNLKTLFFFDKVKELSLDISLLMLCATTLVILMDFNQFPLSFSSLSLSLYIYTHTHTHTSTYMQT